MGFVERPCVVSMRPTCLRAASELAGAGIVTAVKVKAALEMLTIKKVRGRRAVSML